MTPPPLLPLQRKTVHYVLEKDVSCLVIYTVVKNNIHNIANVGRQEFTECTCLESIVASIIYSQECNQS